MTQTSRKSSTSEAASAAQPGDLLEPYHGREIPVMLMSVLFSNDEICTHYISRGVLKKWQVKQSVLVNIIERC